LSQEGTREQEIGRIQSAEMQAESVEAAKLYEPLPMSAAIRLPGTGPCREITPPSLTRPSESEADFDEAPKRIPKAHAEKK
jgi:hypothetical protein